MKPLRFSLVLLTCCALLCAASCKRETPEDVIVVPIDGSVDYTMAAPGDVEELHTEDDFVDFIENNEIAVIKFGAEWCQPCKELDPHYDKIAGYFQVDAVAFARVNVDELRRVAHDMGVSAIPDTRVFVSGKPYTYILGNEPQLIANLVNSLCQTSVDIPEKDANNPDSDPNDDEIQFDDNDVRTSNAAFLPGIAPVDVQNLDSDEAVEAHFAKTGVAALLLTAGSAPQSRDLLPKFRKIAGKFADQNVVFAHIDIEKSDDEFSRGFHDSYVPTTFVTISGEFFAEVHGDNPEAIVDAVEKALTAFANAASEEESE